MQIREIYYMELHEYTQLRRFLIVISEYRCRRNSSYTSIVAGTVKHQLFHQYSLNQIIQFTTDINRAGNGNSMHRTTINFFALSADRLSKKNKFIELTS